MDHFNDHSKNRDDWRHPDLILLPKIEMGLKLK